LLLGGFAARLNERVEAGLVCRRQCLNGGFVFSPEYVELLTRELFQFYQPIPSPKSPYLKGLLS
jgi:hypothetical protein